jgi:hypothetical protein
VEARARIGTSGYSVGEAASYASSIYSGVFCLLALRGARDWQLGETIQLQQLEDHHIFPQRYLTDHGLKPRTEKSLINSILNRTLVSETTNKRIGGRAPASYLEDESLFAGEIAPILAPHYINEDAKVLMRSATDELDEADARRVYQDFCNAREAEIVRAIRKVCGIAGVVHEPDEIDDNSID